MNACGLELRMNFGFPDAACPAESPLSEFDLGQAEPRPAKQVKRESVAATAGAKKDPDAHASSEELPVEMPPAEPETAEGDAPVEPIDRAEDDQQTEPVDPQRESASLESL